MSGSDEFRRAFGVDPDKHRRPASTIESQSATATPRAPQIQFAGTDDYHPYGWIPDKGSDTCELIWYDDQRQEARQGTFWHYKTLLRVGYQEMAPSTGHMALTLFLADVNLFIEGYNLYPLMARIRAYECAQIEQHSARHHAMVPLQQLIDDRETVITRVQTDKGLLYTSEAVKN